MLMCMRSKSALYLYIPLILLLFYFYFFFFFFFFFFVGVGVGGLFGSNIILEILAFSTFFLNRFVETAYAIFCFLVFFFFFFFFFVMGTLVGYAGIYIKRGFNNSVMCALMFPNYMLFQLGYARLRTGSRNMRLCCLFY